jgi:DNA-binding CsgD family transcriptional regulator
MVSLSGRWAEIHRHDARAVAGHGASGKSLVFGARVDRVTAVIPVVSTVAAMTGPLPSSSRLAVLLVALEPGAPRARIEAALVLLGHRASMLDDALATGLVALNGGRLEACDPRVGRSVVQHSPERERCVAHLALASARTAGGALSSRLVFDALTAALVTPRGQHVITAEGPDSLTPRERSLAELAATGAPVREIARAAFLSPKTVETHLTRVYRKLGVRSKAELACAFRVT